MTKQKNKEVVLTVVRETEILEQRIQMYGSIEFPWFLAKDVAKWIEHSNVSMMLKGVDNDEKSKKICDLSNVYTTSKSRDTQEVWVLSEDGLYECCMHSKKPIAKDMKKMIKSYLRNIRLTGAAIVNEQKTVDYYFASFSDELKIQMFNEIYGKNKELQNFYDSLMNTEGLMSMNIVSKELNGIGLKTLFAYLRGKKIMFYKDGVNIPYQRFMTQGLFKVKETPCQDGKIRSVTYSTKKGLEYIRKQLSKDGTLCTEN